MRQTKLDEFFELEEQNRELEKFGPDYIYIHTSNKNLNGKNFSKISEKEVLEEVNNEFLKLKKIWENLRNKYNCEIIQNNFEWPQNRIFGNLEGTIFFGEINFINKLNLKISKFISENNYIHINDIAYLASKIGLDKWYSTKDWYMYKYAFGVDNIPIVCKNISNIIKSVYGKSKKCIVLDLDNTLWGGIIGDDGINGIVLGNETAEGQAYLEFHKYLIKLKDRGILLAISSKNTMDNALLGLSHPNSILKKDDFVDIQADWELKTEHIKKIAKNINILEDSIVFIDDNPFECDIVAKNLPDVEVIICDKIEEIIEKIDREGFFEIINFDKSDLDRNKYYKDNIKREKLKDNYLDYDEYLRSLEMKASISNFKDIDIERITQLINKTNQFNLTTKRLNGVEVENKKVSEKFITLQGRLVDKFGDNGIVSLMIGQIKEEQCDINLWVMSCRVFKRNFEYAMFDKFIKECIQKNIKTICGKYIRTNKNKYVENLYRILGFKLEKAEDGIEYWMLYNIDKYKFKNNVIEV